MALLPAVLFASGGAAGAGAASVVRLPTCEGILSFVWVPAANLDDQLPAKFTVSTTSAGLVQISVHAEECTVQVSGDPVVARWAQVRVPIDKPAESQNGGAFDSYGLAWITDDGAFARWARGGTADYVYSSSAMSYSAPPVNGSGDFKFELQQSRDWAFKVTATVSRPDAAPGAGVTVDIWRDEARGTVVYDAVAGSDGAPGSGIRFGAVADGTITTPAGSRLADILKGGVGCSTDGTSCAIAGDDDNFVVVDHWTITKSIN